MDILNLEQKNKISDFLNNPNETYALVIIGPSNSARYYLLNEICQKYGWKITEGIDLACDIIDSFANNNITKYRKKVINQPALVINELDFFKEKENLQRHLEKIILTCRNPVILTMESYEDFAYDIRAIVADSTVIRLE